MEFRARLGRRAGWVEGHSISFGQSMAFHPLTDLLRRNFRIEEHDDSDRIRAKVAAAIERVGPGIEQGLPPLLHLLGVAAADDPVHHLAPEIRRAETFEALRQLLLRAAARKPEDGLDLGLLAQGLEQARADVPARADDDDSHLQRLPGRRGATHACFARIGPMSGYTKTNLRDVENQAPNFGMPQEMDALNQLLKAQADVIVANRHSDDLSDVVGKVYTRDIYGRD